MRPAAVLFAAATLLASTAYGQAPALHAPRFVLNRSLFLVWDQYGGGGFARYEVHQSTTSGFTPGPSTLIFQAGTTARTYYEVRNLSPTTTYYYVLRTVTTGGDLDSGQVQAQTLPDGNEAKIPIIMFHHIQPRNQFPIGYDDGGWYDTDQFTALLDYFNTRNVHCITHREYVEWRFGGKPLPPNPVMLTFDDGWKTFRDHAAPLLVANECRGVQFVLTRMAGQYYGSPAWPSMPLMTWGEVTWCVQQGVWIGSHTCTHADLHHEKDKLWEIAASRDDLIAQFGVHPEFFCYPWGMGYGDADVLAALAAAAYTAAVRTYNSYEQSATAAYDRYQLPRIFPFASESLHALITKMNMDTDKDGLKNHVEMSWGLRDDLWDGDGDGLSDYYEVAYDGNAGAYNPYPSGNDLNATNPDTDGDGLTDGQEISTYQTNPRNADTDGDGMTDGYEVSHSTNPKVRDPQQAYVVPAQAPGVIEVENYDFGGQGEAYNDLTAANEGGQYRPAESVDISFNFGASNLNLVGWARAGEWLEYTLDVATAGVYNLSVRAASQGAGGRFRVLVNGGYVTDDVYVPDTGGWGNWTVISRSGIVLNAGQYVMRLSLEGNGGSGYVGNLDQIQWVAAPPRGPAAVPGTFEVEDFLVGGDGLGYSDTTGANEGGQYRPTEGVDITAHASAGNGYAVGWTKAGEWMAYVVDVATTETYAVSVRAASSGAGGTFRVTVDGADVTGALAVPNTGGWFTWNDVTRGDVGLTAGIHTVRVAMVSNGPYGYVGNFDRVTFVATPPQPVAQVPGAVEMENFDAGGEGVAYHDTTAANEGGQYRPTDGVDIAASGTASNGYLVGWARAGEWMRYKVNVTTPGTYDLMVRLASSGGGGSFNVTVDGADVTGTLAVPNTGGWFTWGTVTKNGVALSAGIHTVRVAMVSGGSGGWVGNFDQFRFGTAPAPVLPKVPGWLEAEDFDAGGEGVAYHDTTGANEGGQYRPTEGVDIAAGGSASNGYLVGWAQAGEWMRYTVDVQTSATYSLSVRVACSGAGGTFNVTVDGTDVTGPLVVPSTGGWFTWNNVTRNGISLSAGIHTMRVVMVSAGASGWMGNFDGMGWAEVAPLLPPSGGGRTTGPIGPADVITSDDTPDEKPGWAAADGDATTSWRGKDGAGGWWIALTYAPALRVDGVALLLDEDSLTNALYLWSNDADTWYDLAGSLTNGSVTLDYLWLVFPDDGSGNVPAVREIQPR